MLHYYQALAQIRQHALKLSVKYLRHHRRPNIKHAYFYPGVQRSSRDTTKETGKFLPGAEKSFTKARKGKFFNQRYSI